MTVYWTLYPKLPFTLLVFGFAQFNFAVFSNAPPIASDLLMVILALMGFIWHFRYCGHCIRRRLPPPPQAMAVSLLFVILTITSFAQVYRLLGLEFVEDRFDYIYFSTVTFTTLGYGDITPSGYLRIAAIVQAILGYIMVPLIVGQVLWSWSTASRKGKYQ